MFYKDSIIVVHEFLPALKYVPVIIITFAILYEKSGAYLRRCLERKLKKKKIVSHLLIPHMKLQEGKNIPIPHLNPPPPRNGSTLSPHIKKCLVMALSLTLTKGK